MPDVAPARAAMPFDELAERLAASAAPSWRCPAAAVVVAAAVVFCTPAAAALAAVTAVLPAFGAVAGCVLLTGALLAGLALLIEPDPVECMCESCIVKVIPPSTAADVPAALATMARRVSLTGDAPAARRASLAATGPVRDVWLLHSPRSHDVSAAALGALPLRLRQVLAVASAARVGPHRSVLISPAAAELLDAVLDACSRRTVAPVHLALLGPFSALEAEVAASVVETLPASDVVTAARAACAQ